MANTWKAAKRISSVFVVTRKSYLLRSYTNFTSTERQQRETGRQEEAQRVVREHHAHDLHAVAARVLDRVELRLARALAVLDRDVLHRVAAREERHRHGGDAREAGREVAEVLARDIGAECAESGVEVGDLRLGEEARELADEPLGRHPQALHRAFFSGTRADDLVVAVELFHEARDRVVRVRHVDVGPHGDAAARGGRTRFRAPTPSRGSAGNG